MAKKQEIPKTIDEALSVFTEAPKLIHTYFGIQREGDLNQVIQLDEHSNGSYTKSIVLSHKALAVCVSKVDEMVVRTTTIKKLF